MSAQEVTSPLELSLGEAAAEIRAGRLTSVALTEACLERIDAVGPRLNAFISLEREAALAAAARADADLAAGNLHGPLHGVPLAHKDMFYRSGRTATCGSAIRRNYVPDITATVLTRLDEAGALDLGALNMSEFAAGPTGHNEHFGHCHNPWHLDHITGGSSSGSGAATAGRLIFGALGSDTGGSVRLPAAMCGLVGLKPTQGRISRYGAMPRAWSVDTMGPLARTVSDCALLTGILAGADPNDSTCADEPVPNYLAALPLGVEGWRIGVPVNYFYDDVDEGLRDALRESLAVYEAAGATLVEVELPDLAALYALSDTVSKCEAATIHRKWMEAIPEQYGAHTHTRVEAGFHLPATRYLEALSLRALHTTRFVEQVFGAVDVLHAPVIGMEVPTIAETDHHGAEAVPALVAKVTRLTRPMNYLGLPALSVPCGFSGAGLPYAFQLIGRPFGEDTLFRAAAAYEDRTSWHRQVPALS